MRSYIVRMTTEMGMTVEMGLTVETGMISGNGLDSDKKPVWWTRLGGELGGDYCAETSHQTRSCAPQKRRGLCLTV